MKKSLIVTEKVVSKVIMRTKYAKGSKRKTQEKADYGSRTVSNSLPCK